MDDDTRTAARPPGLDLYWIPLGAGRHVVRLSGALYESLLALRQRRRRRPLFHSALIATTAAGPVVVELAEIRDGDGPCRGVVAEGPVGVRWLRRFRLFRYEVRLWPAGVIDDLCYAVGGPVRLTDDLAVTRTVLDLVPTVPTLVWGRDEESTGDMWNSNSLTSWLLTLTGLLPAAGVPPDSGRAPGWDAGVAIASRA